MKTTLKYLALMVLTVIFASFFMPKKKVSSNLRLHSKKSSAVTANQQKILPTKKSLSALVLSQPSEALSPELQKELGRLPLKVEMVDLADEEVHDTPESIEEAGVIIGKTLEKAKDDPTFRPQAMAFFIHCAQSEDVVDPIRALCWNKVLVHIPEWDIFVRLSEVKIPKTIQFLASSIDE